MSDHLVVDSVGFDSPGDGFANIHRLCSRHESVCDLNWSRLESWRGVITQLFDGPRFAPYAGAIRSLRIEFGRHGSAARVTSEALLLLGWLGNVLHWEPETTLDGLADGDLSLAALQGDHLITIDLHLKDHGEEAAGRLMAVEIVSEPNGTGQGRFTVTRTEDLKNAHARIHTEGGEISRVVPLEARSDVELLADVLDTAGYDPFFDRVVDVAARMAGREVWSGR
jgi:glucose-6-phosphate dehydrogenase assembly protein OpcA